MIDPTKKTKTGALAGFIPHRLELPERPEMRHFPLNVLFASYRSKVEEAGILEGSALYEPMQETYEKQENVSRMKYRNVYGGDCYLMISYDEKKEARFGEKFVNGKSVVSATGGDNWEKFFVHLTMLGLSDGEACKFEVVEKKGPR